MEEKHRRTVFFIGSFPPPLHGQSNINMQVYDFAKDYCRAIQVDLSPRRLDRGLAYAGRRLVSTVTGILKLLANSERPATAYISVDSGMGVLFNILHAACSRIKGYRLYFHHHSFSYIDERSWMMTLLSITGGEGSHIFLCESMRDSFLKLYPAKSKHALVCGNAAFVHVKPATRPPRGKASLTIGLLSNLCEEKGLLEFLSTLALARSRGLNVSGVLAGPPVSGADASVINQAKDRFGPCLEYLGPVYAEAKDAFFQSIDVFLFPTRYKIESYGLVVVEALMSGAPVISYSRGCIPDFLSHPAGHVVPLDSAFPDVAVQQLQLWIDHPESLQAARSAALSLGKNLREDSSSEYAVLISELTGAPQIRDTRELVE